MTLLASLDEFMKPQTVTGCQFESGTEKRHGLHRRGEVGHIKRVGDRFYVKTSLLDEGGSGSWSMVEQYRVWVISPYFGQKCQKQFVWDT